MRRRDAGAFSSCRPGEPLRAEHPGHEGLGVSRADLRVGGIGTWPQAPTPPFWTFSISLASADLSPFVLGSHVLVSRADELLVDGVAGETVLGLGQIGAGVGEGGGGTHQASDGGNSNEFFIVILSGGDAGKY